MIEAKKKKLKLELEQKEIQEIESARKKKLDYYQKNIKKHNLNRKPLYKRAEGLVALKNKNITNKQDDAAFR